MEKVFLGLGSNIGNRAGYIKKAIKGISLIKGINIIARSSLYETEPWGLKNQRKFLNCVIVCLSKLKPYDLFRNLRKLEQNIGRKRRVKWGPREIDIDILFFGNRKIKTINYTIPHPMIATRNFVLVPLVELFPSFVHPVLKIKLPDLLKKSNDYGKVEIYN
ncbi:MAG TPA: 2-amino-4-hydroxy-6-hydroxymethyldihydropteridine diphosphokinase [Ignavibacteria bacterium]|nr:2-amino-4-hydroxy-6-hydroxymethyldihydropteridine diphosphokinase [Ignavibacteria bacterium]